MENKELKQPTEDLGLTEQGKEMAKNEATPKEVKPYSHILLYDLEIANPIPDEKRKPNPNLKYCEGWEDHEGMGISVNCFCTINTDIYCENYWYDSEHTHKEDATNELEMIGISRKNNFEELLEGAHVLVGFNNQHFDDKLLKANGIDIPEDVYNYDLLAEIWEAVGLGRTFEFPTYIGLGLDDICRANKLGKKHEDAYLAPIRWQLGKLNNKPELRDMVIDYGMNDIKMTVALFKHIQEGKPLVDPRDTNDFFKKNNPDVDTSKLIKVRTLEEYVNEVSK